MAATSPEGYRRMKFQPLGPHIDVTFWYELERLKLHEWKLDEVVADLFFDFPGLQSTVGLNLPHLASIRGVSFSKEHLPKHSHCICGSILNFNTADQLQTLGKAATLEKQGRALLKAIDGGEWFKHNLSVAAMYTFADLKAHNFQYVLAFPVIDAGPVFVKNTPAEQHPIVGPLHKMIREKAIELMNPLLGSSPFVVFPSGECLPFSADAMKRSDAVVAFLDPSASESAGWPLRNIITAIRRNNIGTTSMTFLALRVNGEDVVFDCRCDAKASADELTFHGWATKNIGIIEMGSMMDPAMLAASSAKLNMSLMKWRMMPDIDLEKIQQCKALLLGSGTLGCNIARHLLMWGVTKMTFVDRGTVSYSNPVRQTLFEHADVLAKGEDRVKSHAAARAMKRILPTVETKGVKLTIRMPGHRIDDAHKAAAENDVKQLEELIMAHDVVFLLTDSRESRWLPTMLCAAHDKPVINTALGFDSYVVMRHGVRSQGAKRCGCYFCNDVVAPMDSLTARTLDQQCTVTRPGVSAMASALSVELLASLYNHKDFFGCPSYSEESANGEAETVLGIVPHQIRGSVRDYGTMTLYGQQYAKCTACSDVVVQKFLLEGFPFVLKCLNEPSYLEEITGLKAERERVLAAHANWDEDDVGFDSD